MPTLTTMRARSSAYTNGGPAYLFHNTGATNHSLRVKLVGTKSNRDGIGAVVRVTAGTRQTEPAMANAAQRFQLSLAK